MTSQATVIGGLLRTTARPAKTRPALSIVNFMADRLRSKQEDYLGALLAQDIIPYSPQLAL